MALPLAFAFGCGGGSDPSTLAAVRGQVTYQGKAVTCGTIVFAPDPLRGNHGPLANATIRPDGSFVLRTGDALGAVPGWHRVTIVALEASPLPTDQSLAVPHSLLPDKYCDPDLSGLSCKVKPGHENQVQFNLD